MYIYIYPGIPTTPVFGVVRRKTPDFGVVRERPQKCNFRFFKKIRKNHCIVAMSWKFSDLSQKNVRFLVMVHDFIFNFLGKIGSMYRKIMQNLPTSRSSMIFVFFHFLFALCSFSRNFLMRCLREIWRYPAKRSKFCSNFSGDSFVEHPWIATRAQNINITAGWGFDSSNINLKSWSDKLRFSVPSP